jgi:hypothetical protein
MKTSNGKNGRRPQKNGKMEDNLKKRKRTLTNKIEEALKKKKKKNLRRPQK